MDEGLEMYSGGGESGLASGPESDSEWSWPGLTGKLLLDRFLKRSNRIMVESQGVSLDSIDILLRKAAIGGYIELDVITEDSIVG